MPIAITALLFVFWIFMAYRAFQRGDLLMAGLLLIVGVVLTAWRVTSARKRAAAANR